jgi:hypothetical protein
MWLLTSEGRTYATPIRKKNVMNVTLTDVPLGLPAVHLSLLTACGVVILATVAAQATPTGIDLVPGGI